MKMKFDISDEKTSDKDSKAKKKNNPHKHKNIIIDN
jgi:hypothetical protein